MKYVVPVAVLALITAGFAYYTLFAGPSIDVAVPQNDVSETVAERTPDPEVRESFSGAGSLYSLLTRGENVECAITYIPNPVEPEVIGSVFIYGGDLRGDFVVPTPDLAGQMVSSIIIADNTIWQWTDIDGELVGSKQPADFAVASLERLVAPIGFTTEVQYECLSWFQVDYTIFEAPASVLFTDAGTATFEEGIIFDDPEPEF